MFFMEIYNKYLANPKSATLTTFKNDLQKTPLTKKVKIQFPVPNGNLNSLNKSFCLNLNQNKSRTCILLIIKK